MYVRLGTRHSALALWQANHIASLLTSNGHEVELVKITTSGDVTSSPLGQSGGQGLFTKEIQRALLDHRCDLAVHSLKDLPTEEVPDLLLAAVPKREAAFDCLISNHGNWTELPINARIGTGSPRRKSQLLASRSDLRILDIRGNVDTRLKKLDDQQYDAIVLAFAGIHRLGLDHRVTEHLSMEWMLPAVGQGALGLEIRREDSDMANALQQLDHASSHAAVIAERSLLRGMRAGCLAPLAAHAEFQSDKLLLRAKVMSSDGITCISNHLETEDLDLQAPQKLYEVANELGKRLAERLWSQGAGQLIAQSREQNLNTPS